MIDRKYLFTARVGVDLCLCNKVGATMLHEVVMNEF